MSLLKATWELYRDAAQETAKALPRSGPALLFLVLASAFEMVFFQIVGGMGLGMAGGFIMGMTDIFLCGWYLALLRILVVGNRKLMMTDLRETMGDHFNETLTVSFMFAIPLWILRFSYPQLILIYIPIVSLVFNPAPESIYQDGLDGMGTVTRAMKFMQENWPEWLAGHVLLFGLLGAAMYAVLGDPLFPVNFLAGLHGPWMGFLGIGPTGFTLAALGPLGWALAVLFFVGNHLVMVFRGKLYRKLARSNRRGRAWQARMS